MRILSRRATAVAALGLALVAGSSGVVLAQAARPGDPIVGISVESNYSARARVTAVDMATRNVSLAFPDGRTHTTKVSDEVQNLDQVRPGDQLIVAIRERVSFVLSGPGAATPSNRDVTAAARAAPGQRPAAVIGSQTINNWVVVSADASSNTISLVNPNGGMVRTFDVSMPESRAQLSRVKPGDRLTVVQSDILIIAITPRT